MSGDLQYDRLCALKCACDERKDRVLLSKEEAKQFAELFECYAELLTEMPMVPDKHKAIYKLMNAVETLRERIEE